MDKFGNGLVIMALAGAAMGIILAKVLRVIQGWTFAELGASLVFAFLLLMLFFLGLLHGLEPRTKLEFYAWTTMFWITWAAIASISTVACSDELRRRFLGTVHKWVAQVRRAW